MKGCLRAVDRGVGWRLVSGLSSFAEGCRGDTSERRCDAFLFGRHRVCRFEGW